MSRRTIFWIAISYLSIILALGLIYFVRPKWLCFVPAAFGPIPVGVPWFGALGAVLISLTGVFEHEHDWDTSYWPWHLGRPLVGVVLGVVSVLIMQAGILAVGSTPRPQPNGTTETQPSTSPRPQSAGSPSPPVAGSPQPQATSSPRPQPTGSPAPQAAGSPQPQATGSPRPQATGSPAPQAAGSPQPQTPGSPQPQLTGSSESQTGGSPLRPANLLYYLIAFLVGYREETFRELIKRLMDVILTPGDGGGPAPAINNVNPPSAPHDTPTPVIITGSGFTGTQSVRFGTAAAQFKVSSDGQLAVTTPTVATGPFPLNAPLTVSTKRGSATVQFSFT